ncbi:AAA ATPase [Asimina triloba]
MASLPLISRVENLLPLHKTLPSGYLEREASQSQSPQILNPTMCKCKIEKDPQEQPEFESLPERQVDSPPRRRSLRRISDENQNGNANASATDESSGGGVSTRSRKRLRSESTQVISLDSPVKWKSHGKSTNRSRAGNEDVKSSRESGEIRCALLCNSEEKKSKSGLMPKAQTDSPGKRRSPRTKGMENEDQNGSVSEISSLTGSKDVSTPEHKETRSELIQNDSPRKWKSPRRCRNGIRNEDNVCENNVIGSGRDSTPERKKLRSESMPESKLDSPLRWRSPRRCTHGDSNGDKHKNSPQKSSEAGSEGSTPQKQIFASQKTPTGPASSPKKWTSPRRCANVAQNGSANVCPPSSLPSSFWNSCTITKITTKKVVRSVPSETQQHLLRVDSIIHSSRLGMRLGKAILEELHMLAESPFDSSVDSSQINAVKEALHVSVAPSTVVCREEEQKKVLEFCKACIEYEKAGSLYICGCPGTGKTLSMEKVKAQLLGWIKEMEFAEPDVLALTCTSLGTSSEIFSKILERCHVRKKKNGICSPLQQLQNLFSQKKQGKMMLVVVDEMDYLITRDRAVLHDLFMLTTFPLSRFILVGKPMVITFRAYCKEQILRILHQRLMVFHLFPLLSLIAIRASDSFDASYIL